MTTTAAPRKAAVEEKRLQTVKTLLIQHYGHVTAAERDQLRALDTMIDMATDRDWDLPHQSYCDIHDTAVASYLSVRWQQRVPASIPDLVRKLRNEIQAYREFCEFRDSTRRQGSARVTRVAWLESKREQLPRHGRFRRTRPVYRRPEPINNGLAENVLSMSPA